MPRYPGARHIPLSASYIPTLHIYRHLLREASYLPLPVQPFVRSQIRTQFHRHAEIPSVHTPRRLAKARHALRYLHAANNGLYPNMFRLVNLAFGRIGPRRRALISSSLARQLPVDSDALEKQLAAQQTEEHTDWLERWDLQKLHALATSQASQGFYSLKPDVKAHKLEPEKEIPKTNIWGRPLAKKLVRSKRRKWYKRLINRVMAPVGRGQWEALRDLASGDADRSLYMMPPRRTRVERIEEKKERETWDWRRYAVEPVRSVERGMSRSKIAWTGQVPTGPYGARNGTDIHDYSSKRFWRRLYMRVWEATPTMAEKPGEEGQWNVEWGGISRRVPVARPEQMAFFDGEIPATASQRKKRGHTQLKK